MKFRRYKMSEIATIAMSNVDKKTNEGETPVKLCNFVDVYRNWAITKDLIPSFMSATAKPQEVERFTLSKGQVALTKDSETRDDIGIATYIADNMDKVLLGYHCAVITPNSALVDSKYLNAYMHSNIVHKYFENNASGSGQRYTLSYNALLNIPVLLPDLESQKEMGQIFSNIDRKIALNRQINDNLEAMAKQLYDYWFVQFDFPDENGKPYKSNGGKMVWNECMKKSIPADWKTSLLSEWIDYSLERVSTSVVSDGDYYTPIEVIPRNKMSLSTTLPVENAVSGLCRYKKKDILLSNRRVYFHKICLAPFDGLTRDTVMVLRPKHEENLGYIYETMFSDSFISYATKVSYGSLQPVLSWTEAQKYHVLTPAKNLSEKYGKLINGIIEKVLSSQMEIIQLTKQRDELLPLLMNGQATVNYHLSFGILFVNLFLNSQNIDIWQQKIY